MATYVVLATLTDKGREDVRGIADRRRNNLDELRQAGISVVADYALMGAYDFLYVVEAPDNNSILEQVVKNSSVGTLVFHTMPAVPMDEFVSMVERLQS